MEAVVRVRGERWRKKVVFGEWVEGTERKIVEGEREAKRRGILRKVEEDIGVGVRVREEEQGLDMGSLGIEVEKVRIEGDWDLATTIAQVSYLFCSVSEEDADWECRNNWREKHFGDLRRSLSISSLRSPDLSRSSSRRLRMRPRGGMR